MCGLGLEGPVGKVPRYMKHGVGCWARSGLACEPGLQVGMWLSKRWDLWWVDVAYVCLAGGDGFVEVR